MRQLLTALLALGLTGSAFAQDDKKVEGKQDGGDEKKLIEKDGGGVKKPAGDGGEAAIPVKDVDTNGDGMISASELKAALGKLGGYYGGDKKGVKPDGGGDGVKKLPVKEGTGDVKKVVPKEGDGDKKAPVKDGSGEKKAPAKDGGDKQGEKAPSKDGSEKTGGK